jgi:hypothetical protein
VADLDQFLQFLKTIIEERRYLLAVTLFGLLLLMLKNLDYLGSFSDVSIVINTIILLGGLSFFILLSQLFFGLRVPLLWCYEGIGRLMKRRKLSAMRQKNFADINKLHAACLAYIINGMKQQRFAAQFNNDVLASMVDFHLLETDSPVSASGEVYFRVPDEIMRLVREKGLPWNFGGFNGPPWVRNARI